MLSFGAGVQTSAMLVLIAQGRWPRPDVIAFADTGNERAPTYDYLRDVAQPYATAHGLTIEVLGPSWRTASYQDDLETYSLNHRILPGTWRRWCTSHYKIVPLHRYQREVLGATAGNPCETWIGISTDEARRAVPSQFRQEVKRYPLLELGLSRAQCETTIAAAGLPVPAKSGCWFCPFMNRAGWQTLKRNEPDLFGRAVALEENARRKANGRARYLPMFGPLAAVAAQDELPGFDAATAAEAGCVTGACFV